MPRTSRFNDVDHFIRSRHNISHTFGKIWTFQLHDHIGAYVITQCTVWYNVCAGNTWKILRRNYGSVKVAKRSHECTKSKARHF